MSALRFPDQGHQLPFSRDCGGHGESRMLLGMQSLDYTLYQVKNPTLDPFADDVVSLGLGPPTKQAGFQRGGVNIYLAGY